MLSLLNLGIDRAVPLTDSVLYMNSINYSQSIGNDNGPAVEKIKDLISESDSNERKRGLLLLDNALGHNPEIYIKGNWTVVLKDILKDPGSSYILKQLACDILCKLIPSISADAGTIYGAFHRNFTNDIFPLLLREIDKNSEWSKAALICVHTFIKSSPISLIHKKEELLDVILRKVSSTISSEIFEIIASCFSEMPNIIRVLNPQLYTQEWNRQYLLVLNTLQQLLSPFITIISKDSANDTSIKNVPGFYVFTDEDEENSGGNDVVKAYLKGACRYINLSKCLAKMLSTRSRFSVEVPLKMTLKSIIQLFEVPELKKIKPTSVESQIICSLLSQMQVASLVVLESLLLNFNMLQYSKVIAQLFESALAVSKLCNISAGTVSQIRHAVWKLTKIFIYKHGSKVSCFFIRLHDTVIQELLEDISVKDTSEENVNETTAKSKKNVANSAKGVLVKEELRKVCKEALQTLHQLVYTGSPYFVGQGFMEIFSKILEIAKTFRRGYNSFPFPYDDESIRKKLYAVLLALTVISNLEQSELTHSAIGIFKIASRDPSCKVSGFCNIAMATLNTKLYPKRPPLMGRVSIDKQRLKLSSANVICHEWSSEDFVPSVLLKHRLNTHEHPPIVQRSNHQDEIDEEMEVEPQYAEHYAPDSYVPNQQNGEEIRELQPNPLQEIDSDDDDDDDDNDNDDDEEEVEECENEGDLGDVGEEHDEDDDDEEEEDEEEEDDVVERNYEVIERNYEDVEGNYKEVERNYEEEVHPVEPENMYIPTTIKLQVLTPVHISAEPLPQNIADQEYELRPSVKTESNIDNVKNIHLNGEHSIVPDGDGPSSTTEPSLANENGIIVYDEEEEEEEEVIDDDEEEETKSFPAEKRVPNFYSSNHPPTKRQRLDSTEPPVEATQEVEDDEIPASPTLTEMKADFCCNEIEDVKS